jgi:prepilin-type N-terminal cleavage/methylation domain-containing protein
MASKRGYTLMELLVAMSLLVLLGGGLVSLLSQGLSIWRTSENRGRAYEQARAVLEWVSADLRSTITAIPERRATKWLRFVCDEGPGGRQRLRFVRTIGGETSDPILREGGRYVSNRMPAAYDGLDDAEEAADGLLAPPGGAMEIFYMLDPRPGRRYLWRGVRSPVGGPGSLLVDLNVTTPSEGRAPRRAPTPPDPAGTSVVSPLADIEDFFFSGFAAPIADDILHLGFRFWTPVTNTWKEVPPVVTRRPEGESGPTSYWDSTRAILTTPGEAHHFRWFPRIDSLDDPADDVFPERVEVTVVVRGGYLQGDARLAEEMNESSTGVLVSGTLDLPADPRDRMVLIDDEWIAVEGIAGGRLKFVAAGRGRRWTLPAKHSLGAAVELGVTFRRIVEIPSHQPAVGTGIGATRRISGFRGR